jgi:hypothetical protein
MKRQIVRALVEKVLIDQGKRLPSLFHLNVVEQPHPAETTG